MSIPAVSSRDSVESPIAFFKDPGSLRPVRLGAGIDDRPHGLARHRDAEPHRGERITVTGANGHRLTHRDHGRRGRHAASAQRDAAPRADPDARPPDANADADSAPSTDVTVTIDDNFFAPSQVRISAGSTVTWVWAGNALHDVTGTFGKSPLQKAGSFAITFTKPGTYQYNCSIHSTPGAAFMRGAVIVE